jgi:hypothetical protein
VPRALMLGWRPNKLSGWRTAWLLTALIGMKDQSARGLALA